ncbi:head GIN domain-containing protein [Hymenobacter chitinivorans]|uniref:Putative autotransporter adhesin-like protein n=1 Tax=Hymenobacter chitinivorans DSM 11115 TaxID=1121954 RepID=A0A2M9ASU9_9BACT|nr:head GIN domain-containing protein [Hymenobacter chitinivorans]PJJ48778.1 putative autotransporter adhesin-like protein [Hymenobacter chitinivorans DSM 11115]
MKTLLYSGLLTLSLGLMTSCDCDDIFPDKVSGNGPVVAENRTVASFSRLELSIDAEVYLTQGPSRTVRVEAQQNILDVLQTNVNGERLAISYGRATVRRHEPVRVYVTTPDLSSVAVSGSGSVVGQTAWRVDNLGLSLSGSGGIDLGVLGAQSLRTDISGSGAVRLSGDAARHELHLSGSGAVEAYPLTTAAAEVSISGSGGAHLTVTRTLQATISGSGKVYYKGQPALTVHTSGSGRVVDAN